VLGDEQVGQVGTRGDQQRAPSVDGAVEPALRSAAQRAVVDPARGLVQDRGERPAPRPPTRATAPPPRPRCCRRARRRHRLRRVVVGPAPRRSRSGRHGRRGVGHPPVVQISAGQLLRRAEGDEGDGQHAGSPRGAHGVRSGRAVRWRGTVPAGARTGVARLDDVECELLTFGDERR
jgi:hypothetical protein